MLTPLRAEVNLLLAATPSRRKPALRRSDVQDALLATDLPLAADAEDVRRFVSAAEEAGWQVEPADNGWLLMDKPVPVPDAEIPMAVGECGCCLSLLLRHPEDGEAAVLIREIVRAAEAGLQPFERLCARIHRELAAMLRRREPLPGAIVPYLSRAYRDLTDGRNSR